MVIMTFLENTTALVIYISALFIWHTFVKHTHAGVSVTRPLKNATNMNDEKHCPLIYEK